MELLSKGLRSDLAQLDGEILDRGSYLYVRSPKEPEFYWGNLLVFPRAPVAGDYERWQNLFAKEFADQPAVKHQTFTWVRVERGEGQWFGAYIDDQMAASLGFFLRDDFGRFQSVVTIPEARKRGICATLVHQVSEAALAKPETTSLLLVADEDYHAGRIYESLGYSKAEEMRGLCRWPESRK